MTLPDELELHDLTADGWQARVTDAIDAASDHDHTTWLTQGGKRIAKIAPVAGIPEELLNRRSRETEPAWAASRLPSLNPFARDALLQAVARQVEEIHRVLGLEVGEDGGLIMVSRDLIINTLAVIVVADEIHLGQACQVWEALHALASAGNQERDGGFQALYDAGRSCLLRDQILADVPTSRSWPVDVPVTAPGRMRPDGQLTDQILADVLFLVGIPVSQDVIAEWAYGQRLDAYDWAIREHLFASDNTVTLAVEPDCVTRARSR